MRVLPIVEAWHSERCERDVMSVLCCIVVISSKSKSRHRKIYRAQGRESM